MRKIIFLLFAAQSLWLTAFPQYWQQQVNYTIDVSLNDKEHTLDGFEKIEYTNHSPDTLKFIWFHLWPNAYKNDKTAYSDQALENGSTAFYFTDKENRGYINRLDFKVNNITAAVEDHPQYIDIIKLLLPAPLAPGQKINITTPFHVQLPYNFSRSGHDGQSYQVTQWYPKPAVYDQKGWHPMPYLDQGEFYSEFGDFQVSITVPKNYVVAATGDLQDKDELTWMKSRSNFKWEPLTEKVKTKTGALKTITQKFPASSSEIKRLEFKQNNVHDFAWFADKRFIVKNDTCKLASGKIIDVFSYYTLAQQPYWKNSVQFIKDAVRTRSDWAGEYPYNIVSAVQGPESFGGGMEYPTITIISPAENEKLLEFTIEHEVGHNWFYGILGSNERNHPWMDEGINTYYDNRYSSWKYGTAGEMKIGSQNFSLKNAGRLLFETKAAVKKDQPISLKGDEFTEMNYNLVAYYKTGAWMELLEKKLGKEVFDKAMHEYFQQWKFKHPYPEDFKKIIETTSGQNLDIEFSLLDKTGILPGMERKGWKVAGIFSPKTFASYITNPSKDLLLISPIVGLNSYDKLMVGAAITNYKLPSSPFQFLLMPMYSTGAKKMAGLGKLNYSFFPKTTFRKIDLFFNASKFSYNEFIKDNSGKVYSGYQKLVPGIRLTMNEKNQRSNMNRYIQWKSFVIREEAFRVSYDSIFTGLDTIINQSVNIKTENRTLQQLKIVFENSRVLYPYSAEFKIEQGKDFVKTSFTGNYFFNYPKKGGFDLRFFAGKFFYLNNPGYIAKYRSDRYKLKLTSVSGAEDYTYSDYFIGRNRYDGAASQQMMIRDGGLKLRLDQFEGDPDFSKRIRSDNLLFSLNMVTTMPAGILPSFIPLKLFADIGSTSAMWKKENSYGKFVYVAGLQLSFFKNTINVYAPLLYSKEFKNLLLSDPVNKKFTKRISFSIDIANFSLKKISRELDF